MLCIIVYNLLNFNEKKLNENYLIPEKKVVSHVFYRFVDAVLTLKPEVIAMPNRAQRAQNIHKVYTKYKLLNVVSGIDGRNMPFEEKPRFVHTFYFQL